METKYQPVNCIVTSESLDDRETLKAAVVGDQYVGITSMFITFLFKNFPTQTYPTVMDEYKVKSAMNGKEYYVSFRNTCGLDEYNRLRMMNYHNVNCVLVCFSISDHTSFQSVITKWFPEIKKHCRNVPVILVGTKADLRPTHKYCVATELANEMKECIGAIEYIECSALADDNLHAVFETAILASISKKNEHCILL